MPDEQGSGSHELVVAFIGDLKRGFAWDDGTSSEPTYEELPTISVTARDQDLLVDDVLTAAVSRADVPHDPRYLTGMLSTIGFRNLLYARHMTNQLYGPTLVDAHGGAIWHTPLREVTVRQLLESERAGALEGEALRPVASLLQTGANGIAANWDTISAALTQLLQMLGAISTVDWVATRAPEFVRSLAIRVGGALGVYEVRSTEWQRRGALPHDLHRFVTSRAWRPEQLGRLLGCTKNEAEAILSGYGYLYAAESRPWEPEPANSEGDLAEALLSLAVAYGTEDPDDVRAFIYEARERIRRYLESGQVHRDRWERRPMDL